MRITLDEIITFSFCEPERQEKIGHDLAKEMRIKEANNIIANQKLEGIQTPFCI